MSPPNQEMRSDEVQLEANVPKDETAQQVDSATIAKERLRIGPVPSWAESETSAFDPKAKRGDHITYLLIERQIYTEQRRVFVHTAARLESMQAVQHESQWRVQFEPRTQFLTLHWIKIRRGDAEIDHTNLERMRFLQREEGLEKLVLDGWYTLLLVLEDVRPGDVIESCYTIEHKPRLLAEQCTSFFSLPEGIPVARFHFSVRFNNERLMKWKSSSESLKPVEKNEVGEVLWVWSGKDFVAPKPELNTPEWHISYPWIQISDCRDWGTIATAVASAWREENGDTTLDQIAQEIAASESDACRRIERAIQLVQDDFRYLSVNLDLGGYVPTPPGTVARRRFGDCKDLSFLLAQLLKRLGVPARPVLVNTALRKSIGEMLPMAELFNHAIVEFQVQDQTRWVDVTMKHQGGGALNRFIPDCGLGLPIGPGSTTLIGPPKVQDDSSLYELKETILLDTSGGASILGVTLRVRGSHAETVRQQLGMAGTEQFSKERLQSCTNRFRNAMRRGPMQYRDDRSTNELVLREVFEINGFLSSHEKPGIVRFAMPGSLPASVLQMPENAERRSPFALPHPCNVVHIIEVEAPTLRPMAIPRCEVESEYVRFSRRERSLHKYWSITMTLATLREAVAPQDIAAHRKILERIWAESLWELAMPAGYPHPREHSDFGELPLAAVPPPRKVVSPAPAPGMSDTRQGPPAKVTQAELIGRPTPELVTRQARPSRRSRKGRLGLRSRLRQNWLVWAGITVVFLLCVCLLVLAIYAKRARL